MILPHMPSLGVSSLDLGRLRIASGLFLLRAYSAAITPLSSGSRSTAASAVNAPARSAATVAKAACGLIARSSM